MFLLAGAGAQQAINTPETSGTAGKAAQTAPSCTEKNI